MLKAIFDNKENSEKLGEKEMKKAVVFAIIFLLLCSTFSMITSQVKAAETSNLELHDPISINSNSDFTAENGVTRGSGTSEDPYIIENWEIDASTVDGIFITNTDAYFVIRNVWVHGGRRGIHLRYVIYGVIRNAKITGNTYGILLDTCFLIDVTNNDISNNDDGIDCWETYYSSIQGNMISGSWYGICVEGHHNTFVGNKIFDNGQGLYFITEVEPSTDNLVYDNYFDNTKNVYDDGSNQWSISKTLGTNIIGGPYLGGNYYSNYTGEDADGDGLGDTVYDIPGGTNVDYLPLVSSEAPTQKVAYITVKYADGSKPVSFGKMKERAKLVSDYYKQQSYGLENIFSDFVFDKWESLDKTFEEYQEQYPDPDEMWDRIRDDAIELSGIDVSDYDAVVVIQPEWVRSYAEGKKVITVDTKSYGVWAHELGHAIPDFDWHDYYYDPERETRGNIWYWGLMSYGSNTNPAAPIMSYNKVSAGWLEYDTIKPEQYGEYPVTLLMDFEKGDSVLQYETQKGIYEYFIFEGRHPPDSVLKDPSEPEDIRLDQEKGVLLYGVEQKGKIFKKDYVYTIPHDGWDDFKVTLLPSESYLDELHLVSFTCLERDSQLIIKIDEYKPTNRVLVSLSNITVMIPSMLSSYHVPTNAELYDIGLHVYTSDSFHVGMNYTSMQYEIDVEGAKTSGNIGSCGPEWISTPDDINAYYVVDATPILEWIEHFPFELNPDDVCITFDLGLVYYDSDGNIWESTIIKGHVDPGEIVWHTSTITENPDGTYATEISPITWEHVFEDTKRGTMLKISTDDQYFQFIAPDKKFLIKEASKMKVCKHSIFIWHKDDEIELVTIAIDTRIDFCFAYAKEMQTGNKYVLVDKPGIE